MLSLGVGWTCEEAVVVDVVGEYPEEGDNLYVE